MPYVHVLTQADGGPALPVGLQLIGRHMGEESLLHIAHVMEQTMDVQAPELPQL
jgi:Asp-tRNA(Asn)/Glu-tRNA(Gln) amidotransferase A subunit family amidase